MRLELNRDSMIIRDIEMKTVKDKLYPADYRVTKFINNLSLWENLPTGAAYKTYSAVKIIGNAAYMPRSVGVEAVQKFIPEIQPYENYLNTAPTRSIKMEMIHQPRNDIQLKSIEFLTGVVNDQKEHNRLLSLPTGFGKTFVAISSIAKIKLRTLIMVSTYELARQWSEEIIKHSNVKEDEIMILSGQESLEKAITSNNIKIFIGMEQTFHAFMSSSAAGLQKLMDQLGIGIRVFDEAHVNIENIVEMNSISNVEYTFYLTATPGRSAYDDNILYRKVFGSVPQFGEQFDNRYHTALICEFDSHPSEVQKQRVKMFRGEWKKNSNGKNEKKTMFSVMRWANNIEKNPNCFQYYIDELFYIIDNFQLLKRNKNFFIMLPTTNLIMKTYNELQKRYGIDPGLFIGSVAKNDRPKELQHEVILTNEKMLGNGLNVLNLDAIIIFTQFGSAITAKQVMGRLREIDGHNHLLFDVSDVGYPECKRLQALRLKFYRFHTKKIIFVDQTPKAPNK